MNALSAIANWIADYDLHNIMNGTTKSNIEEAASLLAMKQDCAKCKGDGTKYPSNNTIRDDYRCESCHGTGKSDLPILAEVCEDQTLPENPYKGRMIGDIPYNAAQQDMLTPSIDSNGDEVVWMKVKTGRKVNK